MKPILWLFKTCLKAAVFFTLFAFALNNQEDATVHFFFGRAWTAPMVLVVLAAFAAGLAVGVLAMVPRWWRQRSAAQAANALSGAIIPSSAQRAEPPATPAAPVAAASKRPASDSDNLHGI